MSHQYRHRSPFHLRRSAPAALVPLLIVDGASPLGASASTFVALGLLGSAPHVTMTNVAELHPPLRAGALPSLDEMAGALARFLVPGQPCDVVGVGLGAIVALRLALDGGAIRRIVAVDAPVPTYRASEALATERFFGAATVLPGRRPRGTGLAGFVPARVGAVRPALDGALPEGIDPLWFRRPAEDQPGRRSRPVLPSIADTRLARITQPLLCINSPKSDLVTGGDHVARLVPDTHLLRLRTMDTADESEQARVADALHAFLSGPAPRGPAFQGATIASGVAPRPERVEGPAGRDRGTDGVIDLARIERLERLNAGDPGAPAPAVP